MVTIPFSASREAVAIPFGKNNYVSGQGAAAPADYPTTAFFSKLSFPVVDQSGTVRFQAELRDSANNSLLENGLWVTTPDGATTLRSSQKAAVGSSGRQIYMTNTDVALYERLPGGRNLSLEVLIDNDGGLLFRGNLDDTSYESNREALIYLPAER